jgi:hypothetical protein
MGGLQAAVVTQAPSRERFAELGVAWLTEVLEELLPEFSRGLKASSGDAPDPAAPMRVPGGAVGDLLVIRDPASSGARARYSERAWQRALDGLSIGSLVAVTLSSSMLDDKGSSYSRPQSDMMIGVARHPRDPHWVTLRAYAHIGSGPFDYAEGAAPYPAYRQREWAEFIKTWAARSDACYAHVTDDALASGDTALEVVLGIQSAETVPRCREVLRGYSWVTVIAAELTARRGGAAALAASGAFDEVTELPAGQVFLRATPTVQDYEGEPVRRVFETLAPVLLPGRLPRTGHADRRRRLVDADPADFR